MMAEFGLVGERLRVSGRLDVLQERELRQGCLDLLMTNADVVTVDLSYVTQICSRCVGTLATLWIDLHATGRELELAVSPAVKRVLDLAGVSTLFLAPPEAARFKLDGDGLRVRGRLHNRHEKELGEWCRELFRAGDRVVKIDMSEVERIRSRCLGTLVAFLMDLRAAGRELHIVPSSAVKKALDLRGLAAVLLSGVAGKGEPGGKDAGGAGRREELRAKGRS